MTIDKLKQNLTDFGMIELIAPKTTSIMKKGWIKCYDLNDRNFDEFDSFDILIFTENRKFRGDICAPGIATAIGNNEKAKEILLNCINKDLDEGFTFKK